MRDKFDEIRDDELRVIGRTVSKPKKRRWVVIVLVAVLAVVAGAVVWIGKPDADAVVAPVTPERPAESVEFLGNYSDTTGRAYAEHLTMTVNDIPLDIYIPHNARPTLEVGVPDVTDGSIVLAAQAADVRADNGKINGAYVIGGRPMAWGLSKKGYVGIIDGKVTVGVADNSPLFEEATEKDGYFFRQYPLVDNGVLVDNEPKGKSIRKAICDRAGEIIVVMSATPESFHDFAQALVDIQVDNAVYLVGADSYGFFRDESGSLTEFNEGKAGRYRYENYIKWTAVD